MPTVLSSLLLVALLWMAGMVPARAQATAEPPVFLASPVDLKRKFDPPVAGQVRNIRFLTEDDYPPFHFIGPDGQLTGFEVELARALCLELKATCSIQPRRWDILRESLLGGQGDAIIAALKISTESRKEFAFSLPYFRNPGRLVTRRSAPFDAATLSTLAGRMIAVAAGSSHEAFARAHFSGAIVTTEASTAAALDAVNAGRADMAFVDGVSGAFWLNGEASQACCRFLGGPYFDSRTFGEGAGIAVARTNRRLAQALDWALQRLVREGVYARLYLKYFPVGIY